MNTYESIRALRNANPRRRAGFADSVDAATDVVRARLAAADSLERPRRRPALPAVGGALAVAVAAVTLLALPQIGGHGVGDATAAAKRAATLTAASAERSGTATVRITRGGRPWAATSIRWHGDDLAVASQIPRRRGHVGGGLLVVDGTLYGVDPADGSWVVLGDETSIDPDSGTTPDEYLAAVREDVGGATLRRLTDEMAGVTTQQLPSGSTVYTGKARAGSIARESGFKEGRSIRVLPFGYVAHDEAADPSALLDVAITVAPHGLVRELAVSWGAGESAWRYTVTYDGLGTTAALVAPANARPLRERAADPTRTG